MSDDVYSEESLLRKIEQIRFAEQKLRSPFLKSSFVSKIVKKEGNIARNIETCLDTIGDTAEAIASYISSSYPKDLGQKYLYLYGILQSIFVLSDAVCHLSKTLNFSYVHSDAIKKIREIRNHSIGHPTKKGRKEPYSFNQIIRMNLTKRNFTLLIYYENRKEESEEIDIFKCLTELLSEVETNLKKLNYNGLVSE